MMQKIIHADTNQSKIGVAILISDRADFKVRKFIRDKKGHYTVIERPILQQFLTCMCITLDH